MIASIRSAQLRLLLWKFRQSEMKRMVISRSRMNVTTVSVMSRISISNNS